MALSNAERQRRYRERRRAERLKQQAEQGAGVTVRVTSPVARNTVVRELELGSRGRQLWQDLDGEHAGPSERLLIEEACRLADRLDRLDAILRGDEHEWMRVRVGDGDEVTVVVDRALSEARQQQVALARLLGELRQARSGGVGRKGVAGRSVLSREEGDGRGASGVVSIAARIAAKRGAQAAG